MSEIVNQLSVSHFLVLSMLLFGIGVVGVLMRRNVIIVMMSIELMLNAGNLAILAFSRYHGDPGGQALAFIVIAVAAAEAAVGLAILVVVFRARRHINIDRLTMLKN